VKKDELQVAGRGRIRMYETLRSGTVRHVRDVEFDNLITQFGDEYYSKRAAEIGSIPDVTGIKLGTGVTTPSKTGGGAALAAYLTDSDQAIDGGFPTWTLSGTGRAELLYQATIPAGKATTVSPITEAVITNENPLTDATSTTGTTISRALVSDVTNKPAAWIYVVEWTHRFFGV